MDITEKYKPYNFSETHCFIIKVDLDGPGVKKIESKLPLDMKRIKGIYVTVQTHYSGNTIGTLSLGFNESIIKSIVLPVRKTSAMLFHSQPMKLDEEIKTNSTATGFFVSLLNGEAYPMQVKIYLHYQRQL